MVDLATLTGAMVISLGHEYGGHVRQRRRAGRAICSPPASDSGDKLWRQPLGEAYDRLIDSPIADMKNVGPREAGSITAAQFLQRFVDDGVAVGASRHRRHGLVGQGQADLRQGRDRLRRAPARPVRRGQRSRADRRGRVRVDFYQLGRDAAMTA